MALEFDDLTAEQMLSAVGSRHRAQCRVEVETFVLATHFAALHSADTVARDRRLPGGERAIRVGGSGTPRVAEFAMAEFGARMQMGPFAARGYFADALDCQFRLPRIWARLLAGEVGVRWARAVARATRELSTEAAARVDAAMCRSADGRIPWSRFHDVLEGEVTAADPEAAARKEAAEAAREYAKPGRSSEHGMRGFYIRSDVASIARIDATVAYLADALRALGDSDSEDRRRAKACLVLGNPLQAVELLAAFAAHRANAEPEPGPEWAPEGEKGPCPSCGGSDEPAVGDPAMFLRARSFRPGSLGRDLTRLSELVNRTGPRRPAIGSCSIGPG